MALASQRVVDFDGSETFGKTCAQVDASHLWLWNTASFLINSLRLKCTRSAEVNMRARLATQYTIQGTSKTM